MGINKGKMGLGLPSRPGAEPSLCRLLRPFCGKQKEDWSQAEGQMARQALALSSCLMGACCQQVPTSLQHPLNPTPSSWKPWCWL